LTDGQMSFMDEANVAARARARTTDPWTSHAAAASISEKDLRESQKAVLDAFRTWGPMHFDEVIANYEEAKWRRGYPRQSESGIRTRVKELRDAGFIEDTGRTVRLPSGRQAKVWRATS
jgi:hypothetical protein